MAAPKPHVPAVAAMLQHEFEEKEFGVKGKLLLPPAEPTPPPKPDPGLLIEPPPWKEALERGDFDLAALNPPNREPELTALERMKLADGGYDPPAWEPAAPPHQPLVPWQPPPPDWRQEEREQAAREKAEKQRLARERRAELLAELLEENEGPYPA